MPFHDKGRGLQPEVGGEQHRVIWLLHLLPLLLGPLSLLPRAVGAEASLVIDAPGHLIPELEEETGMVGLVDDGHGMVAEVLEGGVDDGVVGAQVFGFEAPVQVDSVPVEEEGEDGPENVEVHWDDEGDEEDWRGAHELVEPVIGDHSEGAGVVEGVVVFVHVPQGLESVAKVVVSPLEEIGADPQDKEGHNVVLPRIPPSPAECVREPTCAQVEGKRGAEGCYDHALEHEADLAADHLGSGVLGVDLVPPLFIGGVLIVRTEEDA